VAFVMLDPDTRRRHLYVVGQISTGKSTLLLNLIAQDLAPGQGLAVLDPHGDLAETVLLHVPRNRSNVIMPCQRARHVGQLNRR
jgi:ABC-type ATPase involved in cell division